MKSLNFHGKEIVIGKGSLEYLKTVAFKKAFVVTGGQSMIKSGVIDRVKEYMGGEGKEVVVYSGIGKNPSTHEVLEGLEAMKKAEPDMIVAVGGGSPIDAAKAMALFYEFPYLNFDNVLSTPLPKERKKVGFIAVPSTSGTGTEVTPVTVITNREEDIKFAIKTLCLKPDIAILDAEIAATMPPQIAAETGMDALTHAMECYTNHALDDFNEVISRGAIEGLLKWLPISYETGSIESREKCHHYQCMAGIGFANVGLGMVHGISHSYGAKYNLAHGVANAIILPYVLDYNRRNEQVRNKLAYLSERYGCDDIVEEVKKLKARIGIPHCFKDMGISEETFKEDYEIILDHSMMGSTAVNPVVMTKDEMAKIVKAVYYGTEIDF